MGDDDRHQRCGHRRGTGPAWRRVIILASVVCQLGVVTAELEGAVTLDISGLRGGSTLLDLGELDPSRRVAYEEVTIRMTSTAAVPYQLTQWLSSPLVNERGAVLELAAIHQELSGGTSGTVRFRGPVPWPGGTTELFTSHPTGHAETLTLIYSVSASVLPPAGTYRGAVTYTLQSLDGSSVDTETVPIRLAVHAFTAVEFSERMLDRLRFGTLEPRAVSVSQHLPLRITSNMPGPFRVREAVEAALLNEQGKAFPATAIRVSVVAEDGRLIAEGTLEAPIEVTVEEPSAAAAIRLGWTYRLAIPEDQPAGVYRGTLRFALAGSVAAAGTVESLAVPIELEVLPVLSLSVQAVEEEVALEFPILKPGEPSPVQTLRFEIRSNLGRPYAVFQELAHHLVDEEGHQLLEGAFRCSGSGAVAGELHVAQDLAVPAGKLLLYRSDAAGSPGSFLMGYTLGIPPETPAGTYQSNLLFTITIF